MRAELLCVCLWWVYIHVWRCLCVCVCVCWSTKHILLTCLGIWIECLCRDTLEKNMLIDFTERGKEREKETSMWEGNIDSLPPVCAWPGIEPTTSWCMGQFPNQLSHSSQGCAETLLFCTIQYDSLSLMWLLIFWKVANPHWNGL